MLASIKVCTRWKNLLHGFETKEEVRSSWRIKTLMEVVNEIVKKIMYDESKKRKFLKLFEKSSLRFLCIVQKKSKTF